MSAKDLESTLREGGVKVSEGSIRIDSARALQRLRDFRFAEPAHWVLEVLRAATLSGAKNVTVRNTSSTQCAGSAKRKSRSRWSARAESMRKIGRAHV